jgi:hypothetical protein
MKLGKKQQARRITPPPIQEAMPPPRQPMASFPTGPYEVPPQAYGPDGAPAYGNGPYGPDGMPWMGPGPDGPPTMGYPQDAPPMPYAPDGGPWMPDPGAGFAPMAYAFDQDGTPLLYAPEGAPGYAPDPAGPPSYAPEAPYAPDPGYRQDVPYQQAPGYPQENAYQPGPGQDPGYLPDPYRQPPAYLHEATQPYEAAYVPQTLFPSEATAPPEVVYGAPPPPPAYPEQTGYAPEPAAAMFVADDPRDVAHAAEPPTLEPEVAPDAEPPVALAAAAALTPDLPQVTYEPDDVTPSDDAAAPWPDFAPINRVADADGNGAGVERLPTATQAHRLRLERPVDAGTMPRTSESRLGRLHLRGGMLGLARASLEQLAGTETLDGEALADLAETRWRTGDLEGGAEAAEAHLQARGDEPIARIIAAEWSAHEGRILDARQLATQVQGQVGEGLERLFAGEPRSAVWPPATPGWMDLGAAYPGRFGLLVGGAEVADPDGTTWPTAPLDAAVDPRLIAASSALAHTSPNPVPLLPPQDPEEASREADRQLQAAERDLARGDLVALADRLGLLLRRDPALAPVILSITEHALDVTAQRTAGDVAPTATPSAETVAAEPAARGGPSRPAPGVASLQMLRGDILRGLGQDADATRAYQAASRSLPGRAITREST